MTAREHEMSLPHSHSQAQTLWWMWPQLLCDPAEMFFLDTFFLDSFPEDPHPCYTMPRGGNGAQLPPEGAKGIKGLAVVAGGAPSRGQEGALICMP